uniref:Uncharacterized protein n=1 Tax=Setaria digitata TaxID=48799 RepID=A0A915Q4I8_9BILA
MDSVFGRASEHLVRAGMVQTVWSRLGKLQSAEKETCRSRNIRCNDPVVA